MTEIRDAVDAAIAGTLTDAGWAELLRAGIATGQTLDFTPRARDYRVISRLNRFSHVPSVGVRAEVVREALLDRAGRCDPNGLLVRGLRIDGELDLDFATLDVAVRMTGVRIEGDLGMTSVRAGDVHIDGSWMRSVRLAHARIDNHFSLVDGQGADAQTKRRRRTFGIQSWMAVAAVFENAGRESEARRLKYEATDRLFRHLANRCSAMVWRTVTKITIGHGYYSQLALVRLAGLWLATTILITANLGAFSPTDCDAAIEQQTAVSTVVPTPAAPDESVVTLTTGSSDLAPTAYPASASRRRGG
ncbi:MAG: hypothetical protein ACTHMF_01670 [Leifsonia sp.]|uniref:hypothetical protein n=1 Tax=Leifsonia sp. TaxID=1870902 RepID=UPI003F7D8E7D